MSSKGIIDPSQCAPPLRSRQASFGDEIAYATFINVGHIGGFQFNILQQIPIYANTFFLINDTVPTNSKYISTKPVPFSNPSGSAGYTLVGSEQWFPLNVLSFSIGGPLGGPNYQSVIRFKIPINQFYFHTGTESGGGGNTTIACVANDFMDVHGGPWT
jgi:hypothetical protein